MFKRPTLLAIAMTVAFLVLGAVADGLFGSNGGAWERIEQLINLPAIFVVHLAGPGHGVPQLVLPFLFSLAFYFVLFRLLLLGVARLGKRAKSQN